MQSYVVSFRINKESHMSDLITDLCFWHYHFSACRFNFRKCVRQIRVAIQVYFCPVSAWFMHWPLYEASRNFSIHVFSRKESHMHAHHFLLLHFDPENCFVEFLCAIDVGY